MTTSNPTVREARPPFARRAPWAAPVVLGCLAIGVVLRVVGLDLQSLWLDEYLAIYIGQQDWGLLLERAHEIRGQAPFYYAVMHVWSALFGHDDPVVIRALSCCLGLVSLVQAYAFARRVCGERRARVTLALLAVSPAHIYFSQEARMYPLLAVLVLAAIHLVVVAVRDPRARSTWRFAGLAAAVALSLYTHYYAVLFIGALDVWVLLRWQETRPLFWKIVAAQVVGVACFAPWIPSLLYAASGGGNTFIQFVGLKSFYTALVFALGYSAVPIDAYAKADLLAAFASHAAKLAAGGLAFGWLFVAGLRDLAHRDRSLLWLVLLVLVLPVVAASLVSLVIPVISERYFFPALPLFALVVACGIAATQGLSRWIPLAVAGALTGVSLFTYYFDPTFGNHDWRAASAYVAERAEPGDVLLFHPAHIEPIYGLYAHDGLPRYTADDAAAVELLPAARRVWMIVSHPTDEEAGIREALDKRLPRADHLLLPRGMGIHIYLYAEAS